MDPLQPQQPQQPQPGAQNAQQQPGQLPEPSEQLQQYAQPLNYQQPSGYPTGNMGAPKKNRLKLLVFGAVGLVVLLILVMLSLSLFGSSPSKLADYSSERFGTSLKYPANWSVDETSEDLPGAKTVTFTETAGDSSDESSKYLAVMKVSITELASDEAKRSEQKYFELYEGLAEATVGTREGDDDSAQYISEVVSIVEGEVAGYPARKITRNIANYLNTQGETGQLVSIYVFVDESTQIEIRFEAHSSDAVYGVEFDSLISSFSYNKQ